MKIRTRRFNKEKLEAAEKMLKQGVEEFTQRLRDILEKTRTKERLLFRLTPSQLESIQTHESESTAQAARRILLEALAGKASKA
jgi:hypothetical protein